MILKFPYPFHLQRFNCHMGQINLTKEVLFSPMSVCCLFVCFGRLVGLSTGLQEGISMIFGWRMGLSPESTPHHLLVSTDPGISDFSLS